MKADREVLSQIGVPACRRLGAQIFGHLGSRSTLGGVGDRLLRAVSPDAKDALRKHVFFAGQETSMMTKWVVHLGWAVAMSLVAFSFPAPAHAQTTLTWDAGGSDNKWTTQENWTGDAVPAANDIANLTLASPGNQTIVYDTALYSTAALGPRTVTIGNAGGGVTTLEVSSDFYTRVTNSLSVKSLNLNAGGVWRQISGTTVHNDNVLIDGGTLKVEGGEIRPGAWPSGTTLDVRNGGAIEVTGGTMSFGNSNLAVIGSSGSGSLTFGSAGGTITGSGYVLRVGSGTAGTGTVTWNRTADMVTAARSIDIQNGTFTTASDAGRIFLNGGALAATWIIGTSTGTATLNQNTPANIGGDVAADGALFHVGENGTVNWSGGGIITNNSTSGRHIRNQGLWNYTKPSGSATWRVGEGDFRNDGTFSWQAAGGLILQGSSNTNGTGTFRNRTGGLLETTLDGRADLTGTLILESGGTFTVGLGVEEDAGLRVLASGANGGSITLGGHLDYSELSGFALNQFYTILRAPGAGSITGDFATFHPNIEVIDDGALTGTYIIQVVPEPGTFGLMAVFAGVAILRRRLRG
jgi:hypothetical protein